LKELPEWLGCECINLHVLRLQGSHLRRKHERGRQSPDPGAVESILEIVQKRRELQRVPTLKKTVSHETLPVHRVAQDAAPSTGTNHLLTTLPHSLGCLVQLRTLEISFMNELEALPSSIGALTRLQTLVMRGCAGATRYVRHSVEEPAGFQELPSCIRSLTGLKVLDFGIPKDSTTCHGFGELPAWFGELSQLQVCAHCLSIRCTHESHTHTHTHTHSLSLSLLLTHSLTHSLTHALTHSHTHSLTLRCRVISRRADS
jgi:hypothetical protein